MLRLQIEWVFILDKPTFRNLIETGILISLVLYRTSTTSKIALSEELILQVLKLESFEEPPPSGQSLYWKFCKAFQSSSSVALSQSIPWLIQDWISNSEGI